MKRQLVRSCVAVSASVALAVLPVGAFLWIAWHSSAVRDASVWIDLLGPFVLLDVAALWVLANGYLAIRNRLLAVSREPPDVSPGSRTRGPLFRHSMLGLWLGVSSLIFTLPLVHLWTAAPSLFGCIGGLLPHSDALAYYNGAMRLLVEGRLDEWNGRRPINALLLAARLALSGEDLRGALLIQAILLGVSTGLLARSVARDYGGAAGLMLFAILYAVATEHVRTTMSEALGLTLGTLAATILWCSARDGRRFVAAFGLTVFTVALNARAGAFLTLPALILWMGWAFKKPGRRFSVGSALLAVSAVAIAFVLNSIWLESYGGRLSLGNENFALTLYGFSTGEPGWTRLYVDHPESKLLDEVGVNHFAYAHAIANMRDHPLDLAIGLSRGAERWRRGLSGYVRAILSVVPYESYLNTAFQGLLVVALGHFIWITRRDRSTWLLLATAFGLLTSGVVVFPDAGYRALVVSYPVFFSMAAVAASAWPPHPESASRRPNNPWLAVALTMALMLTASLGPAIAHRLGEARLVDPMDQSDGEDVLIARVGPETPLLQILPPGSREATFVPKIRDEDLARDLADWPEHLPNADPSGRLHGPAVVLLAYNLRRDRPGMFWVIGPPTMMPDLRQTVRFVGKMRQVGDFRYFDVRSYEPL